MQDIIFGEPKTLKRHFAKHSVDKCLLVCDAFFKNTELYKALVKEFDFRAVFSDFASNPMYESVVDGLDMFRKNDCNGIVAVGGGSAIDIAKCIKLFSALSDKTLYLSQLFKHSDVPLFVIPTTAGTGSESTRYAVVYYNGEKQSITHECILPDAVLLCPDMLKTLPLYQKKCTIMDALCQAIESWWSVNSTDASMAYSEMAIRLILLNYRRYLKEYDYDTFEHILLAANYAGRAINITQTTAAHAMSYKITSKFGLPHGHAVAICLPYTWDRLIVRAGDTFDTRGERHLWEVLNNIAKVMGYNCANEAVGGFRRMLDELGLNGPNGAAGDVRELTKAVNPIRLKNFPIILTEDEIGEMYTQILNIR